MEKKLIPLEKHGEIFEFAYNQYNAGTKKIEYLIDAKLASEIVVGGVDFTYSIR